MREPHGQPTSTEESAKRSASGSACVSIEQARQCCDHSVSIRGHVHTIRNLGRVAFVNLRDQSGVVQVVVEDSALMQIVGTLTPETVVHVEGLVRSLPSGKSSGKNSSG